MSYLWNTFFYEPIYNALIFIMGNITLGDVGFAVIILTVLVRLILFPLSKKSIRSQIIMKKLSPMMAQIKKDYPSKEEQAKKTFELYKKYNINPFSGCLFVIIQLPVIFGLYYVFFKGLNFTGPGLYSFVRVPEIINTNFLGVFDMHGHYIVLALLAGITQFIQAHLSNTLKKDKSLPKKPASEKTFQEQMSDSMALNMKYVFPIIVVFISYKLSAAIALYWITSNLCTILQEWYIGKNTKDLELVEKAV